MDKERAQAMHRYFLAARDEVHGGRLLPVAYKRHLVAELERQGVSPFETDALLAIAGHPFASDWAGQRYGGAA